ncbi:unnamed protein product, partial [Amoebophrya sp. A120]|eukprot:GSA120T00010420001.1
MPPKKAASSSSGAAKQANAKQKAVPHARNTRLAAAAKANAAPAVGLPAPHLQPGLHHPAFLQAQQAVPGAATIPARNSMLLPGGQPQQAKQPPTGHVLHRAQFQQQLMLQQQAVAAQALKGSMGVAGHLVPQGTVLQ